MGDRRLPRKKLTSGIALLGLLGGLGIALQSVGTASAAGTSFYVNPDTQAARWVAQNPGDPKTATIRTKVAEVPAATWFATYDANTSAVTASVRAVTGPAATQNRTAVVVPYMIPNRDCGSHSAGGAPDFTAYDTWMKAFAAGLGDREVYVMLEPDSIAQAASCNSTDKTARLTALSKAGATIHAANPKARVYYDAGHSGWKVAAADLRNAGVLTNGDGIVSNVSNYRTTEDEVAYGKALLTELGAPADLGVVVDTSRNGNGPTADAAWCDPAGRALGRTPTTETGDPRVDAFLWVKLPGEADGCLASAGQFVAQRAYDLAVAAPGGPGTPTTPAPSPSTSAPGTPTPQPSTGACTVTYRVTDSWTGGYRADVVLKNGPTALTSWTLGWTLSGGQRLSSAWNVVATQDGTAVRAANAPYNGALAANGSVSLGFVAEGQPGSAPAFTLNGTACSAG
ncbi:glycoside hydrolase family 6 protein [Streptomyces sp. NPDC086091]|uniref:glycoside hydrolase family 6 protein n=1 Tax=Streptomyces sp. NPDC086091 TaxID=3365751 RepID=UPI0037FDF9B6